MALTKYEVQSSVISQNLRSNDVMDEFRLSILRKVHECEDKRFLNISKETLEELLERVGPPEPQMAPVAGWVATFLASQDFKLCFRTDKYF